MDFDNKTVGKNISKFRKLRDMKASEIAGRLNLSEAAYTKYEHRETAITIDILRQIGEILNIDPVQIIATSPSNFFENFENSPVAFNGATLNTVNEQQNSMMLKLMENVVALNERLVSLLEVKDQKNNK